MSNTEDFETIAQMKINHLQNNAKLLLQIQKGNKVPQDKVQFGIPSTFINSENSQTVWNRGPSIQLEQIPELIEMLQKTHGKYSGKKTTNAKTEKTIVTFADGVEQMTANEDEE